MKIDLIDDLFIAKCTFDQRLLFKGDRWLWDKDYKRWVTSDYKKALKHIEFCSEAAREHIERQRKMIHPEVRKSMAATSEYDPPCPDGLAYLPYQRAGIEYTSKRSDTLIADPPGLGKTIQAIGTANDMKARRVLVVCPASLKVNWSREFMRWQTLGLSVGIATTKKQDKLGADGNVMREPSPDGKKLGKRIKETVDVWPKTDVVIINYELLARHDDIIKKTSWCLLVVDEAHMIANSKANRSKYVWGGKVTFSENGKQKSKKVRTLWATKRLFLTGTPLTKSPIDIWVFCQHLDPKGLGRNWKSFVRRYCDAYEDFGRLNVTGSSNEEELQTKLRRSFMLRRAKKDVLTELPDKRREIVLLPNEGMASDIERELTAIRKMLEEYEGLLDGASNDDEEIVRIFSNLEPGDERQLDYDALASKLSHNMSVAFTELSEYRKKLAIAKAPMVVEHVRTLVNAGEKVVLMCVHKEVADHFKRSFNSCAFLTGSTPSAKRQEEVDRFQTDPDCSVFIGNIAAAGVGHTLTASSIIVFAELSWIPSEMEQAEDRIWRIGQLNACLVQYLIVDGSLDARMIEVLLERIEVLSKSLDQEHLLH